MKTTFLCLLTLVLSALLLTGCWDQQEMNDVAFIMASGYDLTPKGDLQVTLQIANPANLGGKDGSSGGGKKFIVQTMTGKTVHDAFIKIQERMSRDLYEGHQRVILIGEELAKKGINHLLDQFSRDPSNRLRNYILVCKGTTAGKILSQQYPFERVPSEAIRELEKSNVGYESTIRDLLMSSVQQGIEPVIGAIELMNTTTTGVKDDPSFHLAGTALFDRSKMIGYLDDKETRALLWVLGKRSKGAMTTYISSAKEYISIEMRSEISHLKTEIRNDKAHLQVEIISEAVVHENNTDLDLGKPQNLKIAQAAVTESIRKRVLNLLTKTQKEYHQDIIGFGRELHRTDRNQWEQVKDRWPDLYAKADLQVDVSMHLAQMGLTRAPLQKSEHEVKE